MEWLNYHHLLYFHAVAREGSVTKASETLRLAQPTLSGQIRKLEESLDEKLFVRQGRHLALTEVGRMVYRYADEIFSLGQEMMDALRGRPTNRPARLLVGIADVVPKLVCHRLLQPALELDDPVRKAPAVASRESGRREESSPTRSGAGTACTWSGGRRACARSSTPSRWNDASRTRRSP